MKSEVVYVFIALMAMATIALALFYQFRYSILDLESSITGIWVNKENSMRILIHRINKHFQAEVIWINRPEEKILGAGIIRDLKLGYFSTGVGAYIDPVTKDQCLLKFKMAGAGKLILKLFPKGGEPKTQEWKLIR